MEGKRLSFREQIDLWIKDVKREMELHAAELDVNSDAINTNTEEIGFNYENMFRIEQKVDRLEANIQRITNLLEKMAAGKIQMPRSRHIRT